MFEDRNFHTTRTDRRGPRPLLRLPRGFHDTANKVLKKIIYHKCNVVPLAKFVQIYLKLYIKNFTEGVNNLFMLRST